MNNFTSEQIEKFRESIEYDPIDSHDPIDL